MSIVSFPAPAPAPAPAPVPAPVPVPVPAPVPVPVRVRVRAGCAWPGCKNQAKYGRFCGRDKSRVLKLHGSTVGLTGADLTAMAGLWAARVAAVDAARVVAVPPTLTHPVTRTAPAEGLREASAGVAKIVQDIVERLRTRYPQDHEIEILARLLSWRAA